MVEKESPCEAEERLGGSRESNQKRAAPSPTVETESFCERRSNLDTFQSHPKPSEAIQT